MIYIKVITLVLVVFQLLSCKSKYECGYNPTDYIDYGIVSGNIKNSINITNRKLSKTIAEFGNNQGYCVSNGSYFRKKNNQYYINIQITNQFESFHFYGDKHLISKVELKEGFSLLESNTELVCDFLKEYIEFDLVNKSQLIAICKNQTEKN